MSLHEFQTSQEFKNIVSSLREPRTLEKKQAETQGEERDLAERNSDKKIYSDVARKKTPNTRSSNTRLNDYEILYRTYPIIHRAINVRSAVGLSQGFKLRGKDGTSAKQEERAEALCYQYIKKINLNRNRASTFDDLLQKISIDTDVFGNGYWQLENYDILPRHPVDVDLLRHQNGDIKIDDDGYHLGYSIKVSDTESKPVLRRNMGHLTFDTLGDEILGIPLTEIAYNSAMREMNVEQSIAEAIYRHGSPLLAMTVGDVEKGRPATKTMMERGKETLKHLSAKSDIVLPEWYKIKLMESQGMKAYPNMTETFTKSIAAASGVPLFILLGTGESMNRATATELNKILYPTVTEPIQRNIGNFLTYQVFDPILRRNGIDAQVKVEWDERVSNEIHAEYVEKLAQIEIEGKPLVSWEEAREILKLPT